MDSRIDRSQMVVSRETRGQHSNSVDSVDTKHNTNIQSPKKFLPKMNNHRQIWPLFQIQIK